MGYSFVPVTDISEHQGAVDFRLMRARGVRAVIVRLGNGRKTDKRCRTYVPAARAAGLALGWYWFCNPTADPTGYEQMSRALGVAAELGPFDLPGMMDVESYTNEPSAGFPALSGQAYMRWLEDGADTITTADPHGDRPIVYTNRAYFDGMNMTAGRLADCPLIVARYPFYWQGAPQPPTDPEQWDDWVLAATSKRPQVPVGWSGWDGWQFAAGFDRMGPTYGTTSADLDLNIVTPDAYAEWTRHSDHIDSHPDVVPPVVTPTPIQEDDDMLVSGRSQIATLSGGYLIGISAATASGVTPLPLTDSEWDEHVAVSDAKKRADANIGLLIGSTPSTPSWPAMPWIINGSISGQA